MRDCDHGHLDEWAALVGEELPETIDDRTSGPGDRFDPRERRQS